MGSSRNILKPFETCEITDLDDLCSRIDRGACHHGHGVCARLLWLSECSQVSAHMRVRCIPFFALRNARVLLNDVNNCVNHSWFTLRGQLTKHRTASLHSAAAALRPHANIPRTRSEQLLSLCGGRSQLALSSRKVCCQSSEQ